ncbi:MAG: hypothetical protein IJ154_05050 [Bacteroidales bacterium]|nr:hypothetical protein [Bacteroidales bacterium]
MPIIHHADNLVSASIHSPESMYRMIRELGIVPFFSGLVPGWSIEEYTPDEYWFTDEELGPWDWKIDVILYGDIAYGKFLYGGKSAFATVEWYRELMNWKRAQDRYQPSGSQLTVMKEVEQRGLISVRDVRHLLSVKKSAADSLLTRLQDDTLLVIGNIDRVYRGEDLNYNGWQQASFCRPEDLFVDFDLETGHSPRQSFDRLSAQVRRFVPDASDALLLKLFK